MGGSEGMSVDWPFVLGSARWSPNPSLTWEPGPDVDLKYQNNFG